MLNNIVDNIEQCGQQNIVQCCFHQPRTGRALLAVYLKKAYTAKNYRLFQVVANRTQQCCGGNVVPGCQQH